MSGGFGGGSWGGGPWGGGLPGGPAPFTGTETITFSEALTVELPLLLLSATPISTFLVEVTFSHPLDLLFLANFTPSNYSIPGLTVLTATLGSLPNTIRLGTTEQAATVYTLTVATARSVPGDLLAPPNQTADFAGFAISPRFFATAQASRKVMLTFSAGMNSGSPAFTDPTNYEIRDFEGNAVPVVAATIAGVTLPISHVTLSLGTDLVKGGYYVAEVDPAVQTAGGLSISPPTDVFQWAVMEAPIFTGPLEIPFAAFSGEITTGLLGQPAGQVFFSPALNVAVANSIIQVDEVSLCTRAFDEYHFPQPIDPPALFTYSPTAPPGVIGPTTILWASAERLGIARINLTDSHQETMPAPVDGPADATLEEPIDITRAAFLNDTRWKLFPGTTVFITADNLTPIGPGTPININLQP